MGCKPDGEALPADIVAAMLASLSPMASRNPAALRTQVLAACMPHASPVEQAIGTVHRSEQQWLEFTPGVTATILRDDGIYCTWLARARAGVRLPAHAHALDEECLVLEGSVNFGEFELRQGDFHVARAGSRHGEVHTPTGCLVLMRSASREHPMLQRSRA